MRKASKGSATKAKNLKLNKKTVKDLAPKKSVKGGAQADTSQCKSVRWCRD